jgi:hypothetical protein
MNPDAINPVFDLAADFVEHTGRHIFLTGKAGTGKTTFLKHIQASTKKKSIVVAPTGVAAINAGGVTMHSFFQLPLGPFIPVSHKGFSNNEGTDKHSLFRNMRMSNTKRKVMQELELLIIDEVSMVRADLLDCMDTVLRHFRKQPLLPFGGVQVLFIGDMYQLPPVTVTQEWQLLSDYYKSPYFFDAQVIQQAPPLYIELKKIYRQSEQLFIDLLNRVRNNEATENDLAILNNKYRPNFSPAANEKFITLCTHNYKADQINNTELQKLPGKFFSFKGEITGEFNDKALPADVQLQLKEGAQIMFIKNDKGEARRFYNGKLATVSNISGEKITVLLAGSEEEVVLEKETWRNIQYKLNEKGTEVEEEELGTFKQYPIRLAWAVTIHKSQGLTFEKAIIDAGQSFASGQVYVALSRCTSLDGLVLYSRISAQSIYTDPLIVAFANREIAADKLSQILLSERRVFEARRLINTFNLNRLIEAIEDWVEELPNKKMDDHDIALAIAESMFDSAKKHHETALKFQKQLESIIASMDDDGKTALLHDRMQKAVAHFTKAIYDDLITPLENHLQKISRQKKLRQYVALLFGLQNIVWAKLEQVFHASYNNQTFNQQLTPFKRKNIEYKPPAKVPPGTTRLETLKRFTDGQSIDEIALSRNLAISTIEGHLADCIAHGDIELQEVLDQKLIDIILPEVEKQPGATSAEIKLVLGEAISYAQIRMVMMHLKNLKADAAGGSNISA